MTPIDFGKDFLYKYFDQKDADACLGMLAGDLVWITPETMHHFLSEGAVLKFLQRSISEDTESRYVDLISIKSSPSADNMLTVAYEVNLVSREDERPLYLRCSMAICRRSKRLEITFLHFSKKTERNSSEQLQGFVSNLPCGVMILACLDGQREEAVFYNDYFAHRLRYGQEEFARAMERNPFFMTPEEDRERIQEQIEEARRTGGNISANLRFFRRDGNSFYYRMLGAPAYQADGGTVYYCVFQEITGFQLTNERLQSRLDIARGILRQIPEAICAVEYPPQAQLPGDQVRNEQLQTEGKPAEKNMTGGKSAENMPDGKSAEKNVPDGKPAEKTVPDGKPATEVPSKPAGSLKSTKTGPRVFFTSRNIPALFDVSNSAFMKNIVEDPFFGLEITSITRDRLLGSRVFGNNKTGSVGPVSCGIFRLKKQPGQEAAETDVPTADRSNQSPPRVELVVRRVKEKNGTVRLYFFYYDREAQERETEKRVDRAMKMGRAGQDQLRADLQKAKETAARRQSEMNASLQSVREKHENEISRSENRLLEEKNRVYLLSKQLEESRTSQKQMAESLEKAREDASRRVHNIKKDADRKVREAVTARDLLEEQLREAQERNLRLERQLQSERTRRVVLEEQLRETGQAADGIGSAVSAGTDGQASSAASVPSVGDWMTSGEPLTVFSPMDHKPAEGIVLQGAVGTGSAQGSVRTAGVPVFMQPIRDKAVSESRGLTAQESLERAASESRDLTAQESLERTAAESRVRAAQESLERTAAESRGRAAQDSLEHAAAESRGRAAQDSEAAMTAVTYSAGQTGSTDSAEEKAFLVEKRIRAREQEKAQRRLRRLLEQAEREGEDPDALMDGFLEAASSGQVLLQEKEFSPGICLENILRYEDLECTEKGIILRYYKDSRLPARVRGFSALLHRALCELLENAIKATKPGGVISVHCRADRPAEGLINMHFRIDDNGAGISAARMQTIFEAEREAGTDRPVHSGLFAVKEAAALMGGSVHARSGPAGSRFILSVTLRVV